MKKKYKIGGIIDILIFLKKTVSCFHSIVRYSLSLTVDFRRRSLANGKNWCSIRVPILRLVRSFFSSLGLQYIIVFLALKNVLMPLKKFKIWPTFRTLQLVKNKMKILQHKRINVTSMLLGWCAFDLIGDTFRRKICVYNNLWRTWK